MWTLSNKIFIRPQVAQNLGEDFLNKFRLLNSKIHYLAKIREFSLNFEKLFLLCKSQDKGPTGRFLFQLKILNNLFIRKKPLKFLTGF